MVNNMVHGMDIIATLTPNLNPSTLVPKKIGSKESLIQIGKIKSKDHRKQETTVTHEVSKSGKVICEENNIISLFWSFNCLLKPK